MNNRWFRLAIAAACLVTVAYFVIYHRNLVQSQFNESTTLKAWRVWQSDQQQQQQKQQQQQQQQIPYQQQRQQQQILQQQQQQQQQILQQQQQQMPQLQQQMSHQQQQMPQQQNQMPHQQQQMPQQQQQMPQQQQQMSQQQQQMPQQQQLMSQQQQQMPQQQQQASQVVFGGQVAQLNNPAFQKPGIAQGVQAVDVAAVKDDDNSQSQQLGEAAMLAKKLKLHPDVNIVPSTPIRDVKMRGECIPLPKSPRRGVQICIYPTNEDVHVSGTLRRNSLWEEGLVMAMVKALQADPSMVLLDLGCNLGEYALMAAAYGRKVVAVEMLPENVAKIQKSLQLSGLSDKVVIVNNALYSDHRKLKTQFMLQNVGGSRLNTSKVYEIIDQRRPTVTVSTICLDDLTPLMQGQSVYIKMDIENSEHEALACAHDFFTHVNVKIVQIEWLNRVSEEADIISKFMKTHGYFLSQTLDFYSPLADRGSIVGQDAYFIKSSYFGNS